MIKFHYTRPVNHGVVALMLLGALLNGVVIPNNANAEDPHCKETVKERTIGKAWFKDPAHYDEAQTKAVQNAIIKAVKPHTPAGFTSFLSAELSSTSNDNASSGVQKKVSARFYEGARGLTKSVRVIRDFVKEEAGLYFVNAEVDVEVCVQDPSKLNFIVAFGSFYHVDGTPSRTLRQLLITTFPNLERTEKKLQHAQTTDHDIVISGQVQGIQSRKFAQKPPEERQVSFFGSDEPQKVFSYGRYVPRGMVEYVEVSGDVIIQARFVATHKIYQQSVAQKKDVRVTGMKEWRRDEQSAAISLVRGSVSIANKLLGRKLQPVIKDTPLY